MGSNKYKLDILFICICKNIINLYLISSNKIVSNKISYSYKIFSLFTLYQSCRYDYNHGAHIDQLKKKNWQIAAYAQIGLPSPN